MTRLKSFSPRGTKSETNRAGTTSTNGYYTLVYPYELGAEDDPALALPAIELLCLAVDSRYQHTGVGTKILRGLIDRILDSQDEYPIDLLLLVAISPSVRAWYLSRGLRFQTADSPQDRMTLYLTLNEMVRLRSADALWHEKGATSHNFSGPCLLPEVRQPLRPLPDNIRIIGDTMVIETERMTLRRMTLTDVDDLLSIFSDPVAMRFYPSTKTRSQTESWVEWNLGLYESYGHGLWIAHLKETGEFAGQCGLVVQEVDGRREVEIGYLFLRRLWGQGLATEAAAACRDFAFDHFSYPRVISLTEPGNTASRRVAEKVGMQFEKEREKWDKLLCVYGLNASNP